ncbi:sensor protein DivL [bacterium BMS3Abin02]|nr:sensor protein DivL [bacterium BMS3Abin02]GBE23223.1 sensor protein DivL [bacterium BMS3Bbin01]
MSPDDGDPLIETRIPRWQTWFESFDPVGPIVTIHVLALALFSDVLRPVGVLVVAAILLVWRTGLDTLADQIALVRKGGVYLVRGVGSLALVGVIVALDGGTESPFFFAMLIVFIWEAVTSPVRRTIWLAVAAVLVYVGVIAGADDITVTSVVRLGVFLSFIGLLVWGRALSEYWQKESTRARTLAAGIAEEAPIGFALYDGDSLRCLFANETARRFGLADADHTAIARLGESTAPGQGLGEVLAGIVASGEPGPPLLYVAPLAAGRETFLRIGVSLHREMEEPALLMVYAEDVTSQVLTGEQHRRFMESANHQFRTPLSPIVAYSELIAKGELEGEELREAAVAIRDAGARIEQLLDRMNSVLRLQRGPQRSAMTVTIGELIDTYLLAARPGLESVVAVEGERSLEVRCDPLPLTTALYELIENSRRYGTPPVTISVRSVDAGVRLRVCDRGPGPDIDSGTPLGQTWSLLAHSEVMPPEMGDRLGITYAHTLTVAAGGSLRFERTKAGWAFTIDLPVGRPSTV